MAAPGRTVRVRGLPTDIDDDRLSDKLCIHFLRASNGGGDIASVTIVKTTPRSALVTFEDSGVAQSVLRHGRHVLRVDGKKYELTLTEHRKDLDLDQVILSMSVTVDYSQLPRGKTAVMHLHKSHPDVQVDYNAPEELCTLRGLYSEVQAAVAQLLGLPGAPGTADPASPAAPAASNGARAGGAPPRGGGRSPARETADRRGRGDERREWAFGLSSGDRGARGDRGSGGRRGREGAGRAEGGGAAGLQPPEKEEEEEDFSLIMDADTFLYLQRHCEEEYRRILAAHGVEVLDATAQGVTTLFLQCAAGSGGAAGGVAGRLRGARADLSRLHQENEAGLRKAQLPKSVLAPRGGLQRAVEALRIRLPRILLSEDEGNVYIVGSGGDVSEAKQFLLLGEQEQADEDVAGSSRSPSSTVDPSNPGEEEGLAPTLSAAGALDARIDEMLKSHKAERKAEAAGGYRLAARFKDSGVGGLGARPRRSLTAGASASHERLFDRDRAGHGTPARTGEDVSFKNGEPLFTSAVAERTPPGSRSVGRGQGGDASPFVAAQNNLVWGAAAATVPPSGSGTGPGLRRTSSFSGWPGPKARDAGQGEEPGKAAARVLARSSSFSDRPGRDMKEAYAARLQDMTSGLQVRDGQSEGSRDVTVTLMGAESSAVASRQSELQKLVAAVADDFCVQSLRLAELGVADAADETLAACCAEIRQRFRKVTLQVSGDGVFLIGPEQLCSQVGGALREVFCGEAGRREGEELDLSAPSPSRTNRPVVPQANGASRATPPSQNVPSQKGEATGDSQEMRRVQRRDSTKRQRRTETEPEDGDVGQSSARRDPVVREEAQRGGPTEADGSKADAATSHSARGEAGPPNGLTSGSASAHDDPRFAATKDGDLQSEASRKGNRPARPGNRPSPSAAPGRICVCGASGDSLTMTGCGVTLCPRCLFQVHTHCRVCPKAETTAPARGIQGSMTYSEVAVSLPGHSRDSTVKITYCIPDGFQGEGHPAPGSTFQGGVFEAYLPLCERTHRLLPRLERAFRRGLTFTMAARETGARVAWDCVPHKTSLQGGKSANGYPDSNYLTRLSEALTALGIEEVPAKSPDQNKS